MTGAGGIPKPQPSGAAGLKNGKIFAGSSADDLADQIMGSSPAGTDNQKTADSNNLYQITEQSNPDAENENHSDKAADIEDEVEQSDRE